MKFKLSRSGTARYKMALKKRVRNVREEFANEVMTNLRSNTPIRSGKLVSSYNVNATSQSVQISNNAGYIQYVNNGTRHQQGQHFVEKSINEAKLKINEIIKNSQQIE